MGSALLLEQAHRRPAAHLSLLLPARCGQLAGHAQPRNRVLGVLDVGYIGLGVLLGWFGGLLLGCRLRPVPVPISEFPQLVDGRFLGLVPELLDDVLGGPGAAEDIIEELRHETEEPTIDELWELADGDGDGPKPAAKEKPAEPAEEDAEPDIADIKNPEDPISWLRMAGELAAAGRKEEAEMCRRTAMSLLEEER